MPANPNRPTPSARAVEAARALGACPDHGPTDTEIALALDAFAAAERERVATAVANEYGEPRLAARIRAMGGERG